MMLSTVQTPRTKQDLMKAIHAARVQTITTFEGNDVLNLPSLRELVRKKASIIVLTPPI